MVAGLAFCLRHPPTPPSAGMPVIDSARFASRAVAMLVAAACPSAAIHAQGFPNKAIRVIVPFTPGDTADVLARLIGSKMSERMGQQVIVENRAGASGQIGMELAAPDGYTIAVGQSASRQAHVGYKRRGQLPASCGRVVADDVGIHVHACPVQRHRTDDY